MPIVDNDIERSFSHMGETTTLASQWEEDRYDGHWIQELGSFSRPDDGGTLHLNNTYPGVEEFS
jgi:hypothetical protein